MKVTMMLADAAQAAEGKLYILGGGWSVTGPTPSPSAIALLIQVPWDRTNLEHSFRFDLVDSDGNAVELETDAGVEEPVTFEGSFEVGRPPGVKPGTSIDVPLAINVGPLPLPPGGRYEWRLSINQESHEDWRLPFSTRSAAQAGAQA
jgi:uncharacterized protein DUF6941